MSNCLVAYATRHGATAEIAEALAEALRRADHRADTRPADQVEALDPYDAVIVGSAVYYGHWLDPARELAERLAAQLAERPVWLFSSGPLRPPEQLVPEGECVDVGSVAEAAGAIDHRTFAGRLDKSSLGFREKAVVAALHPPEGDFRDWEAIDRYAAEIADCGTGVTDGPARCVTVGDDHPFERAVLPDGTVVHVRAIRPDDRALLEEGFERLSDESRFRRFLHPVKRLGERELDYFTHVDHVDHEALVALGPLGASPSA